MLLLLIPAWKLLPQIPQLSLALISVGVKEFCFISCVGKDGVSSGFVLDFAELLFMQCLSTLGSLKESRIQTCSSNLLPRFLPSSQSTVGIP